MLIDTHCHLDDPAYAADLAEVLARARTAGVTSFVTVGTDGETSRRAGELAQTDAAISAVVGIHPHEAGCWTAELGTALETQAQRPKVVAFGEIGLDYYYDRSPRDVQRAVFRQALEIARRRQLPVVIHCRDAPHNDRGRAWDDLFAILRDVLHPPMRGVLHCFAGGPDQARIALDLGLTISFSGILTFKTAQDLRDVASWVPLDRMLIETDSPYLAPVPFRGKTNNPSYVPFVAQQLATLRSCSVESIGETTSANFSRLFSGVQS